MRSLQRPQHRNLLRGWSRRERQACRHSHSSPESISGRPPLQSRPRLSRCRDPRPSRSPLGSQELSLLRCQGMAEGNRLPSLEARTDSRNSCYSSYSCSKSSQLVVIQVGIFLCLFTSFPYPSALSSHLACTFSSPNTLPRMPLRMPTEQ